MITGIGGFEMASRTFNLVRTLPASPMTVWNAWSSAEALQSWWGPKGCTIKVALLEFRPGGFFHYTMNFPGSAAMWGRFLYREIVPETRIAWLNSFSNPGCGITRAPFDPNIPLEILNEVTMAAQSGKTVVTLNARAHGAAENEVNMFDGMFDSLAQGYGGTFDQLAEYLSKP